MKIKQTIIWDVDAETIEEAQEKVMGEFVMPRDDYPVMEWYDFSDTF